MKCNHINNENGSIILIVALSLTVIMSMAALVIDYGTVVIEKTKFQNAIDATSLSAAHYLPSTTLCTTKANEYIELNGYTPSDIAITFSNSNNTMKIVGTKTIPYGFARIMGFTDITITQTASATREGVGQAFNYALFSGGQTGIDLSGIELTGANIYIEGNVHTNSFFKSSGASTTITGNVEAVTTITTNGSNTNINALIPNAPFINMPDFSQEIKLLAEQAGNFYTGDRNYNGTNIDVDQPIYINGDLNISSSTFSGKGCIIATGDISVSGSNIYQGMDDSICIYSVNGSITMSASSLNLDGILYAPNGSVKMSGANKTINGRIVSRNIDISGSSLTIIISEEDLESLPDTSVRLVSN